MSGQFCPRCGEARVASFRYCAKCAFDFDALPADDAQPEGTLRSGDVDRSPTEHGEPSIIVGPSPSGTGRRAWISLGVVIFVAIVAAAGFIAVTSSGALAAHHTITGDFVLVESDLSFPSIKATGTSCEGTGGYSDISAGAQVTLRDGDGKTLGTTFLLSGTGTVSSCDFTFTIENVPEVPFYSVEISHRGQITNSLADMKADGWTFSLSLGH